MAEQQNYRSTQSFIQSNDTFLIRAHGIATNHNYTGPRVSESRTPSFPSIFNQRIYCLISAPAPHNLPKTA